MTKHDLARQLSEAFETRKRNDGTEFVCLKDGSPEWMTDVIREAHGDMLPDDTRYSMIQEVCDDLLEYPDWSDCDFDIADGLTDVYNADRLRWLASHLKRAYYCDQAADELGVDPETDMFGRLGYGQFMEYREICASIIGSLESLEDELAA